MNPSRVGRTGCSEDTFVEFVKKLKWYSPIRPVYMRISNWPRTSGPGTSALRSSAKVTESVRRSGIFFPPTGDEPSPVLGDLLVRHLVAILIAVPVEWRPSAGTG
jgi:hypothetical protein